MSASTTRCPRCGSRPSSVETMALKPAHLNFEERVRSRRGWDMTPAVAELADLPPRLVLDGELVAWKNDESHFPSVCRRVLNRDKSIPLTFVVFDVLRCDGKHLTGK